MADTKRAKLTTLQQQRDTLLSELNELKNARAEARINDAEFPGTARITALLVEIEALDEAVALAHSYASDEQQREAASTDLSATKSRLARVDKLKDLHLTQISAVQRATEQLASAMAVVIETMDKLNGELTDFHREEMGQHGTNFPELQRLNYIPRIAARMAHELSEQLHMFAPYCQAEADRRHWSVEWDENERRLLENVFGLMTRNLNAKIEKLQVIVGE